MKPARTLRSLLIVGAVATVPVLSSAQVTKKTAVPAAAASTWEAEWDAAWARSTTYYRLRAASTLAADPACQGDLGFHPRVRELVRAIADKRHGEALRLLSIVQDKSMCLDLEGARGLEYALAGFVHRAMTRLSGTQQEIAVHGALNAGTLVFDQLQYTRRSWWLPMMKFHADKLAPIVARYPRTELGFYALDWSRNTLSRGVDPVAMSASMRDMANYGDGTCSMLDLSRAGFKCNGWVGKGGMGGGSKGGSGGGAPGGLPSIPSGGSSVACIASAAASTGARGQLGCAAKAIAGMTFDPRTTTPQTLLAQGIAGGQPGVRDPKCALSEDAGNKGGQTDPEAAKKEPTTWEKIKDTASKAAGIAVDVVVAVFDKTPPVVSDLKPLASPEGADAARGALQMLQAGAARDALLSDDAAEKYNEAREGRVVTDPKANQRTVDGAGGPLGGGPSPGACGRGSNAARRARALFDCISGDSPKPTTRGPNNPLISRVDPDQVQTPPTGAMACMMNGGDMPRDGFNDTKCANARCVQGALSCPCDKAGGNKVVNGGTLTPRVSASTSPNCATPPCGPIQGGGSGGGTPNPPGGGPTGPGGGPGGPGGGPGGPVPPGPLGGPGPRLPR